MTVTIKLKKYNSFIKELGVQRYYEFEHQIIMGMPSRTLAKEIQSEGFFQNMKLESLAANIRNFRLETIFPKARRLLESISSTNITKLDKAMCEQRNIAMELSRLIAIQNIRVNKGIRKENEDNEIYRFVNREIQLLCKLLESYGQFQIKAGLLKTIGSQIYAYPNEPSTIGAQIQKFIANEKKHAQIAEATRKAMKILNKTDFQIKSMDDSPKPDRKSVV